MSELDMISHILPAGTELNGKYEVIKVIGEGGFGITYLGHNKVLDIPVAIKEYYPKGYASRTVSQNLTVTITDNTKNAYFDKWKMKFLTEARMLAKFANLPGIVNVYDFFEQNGTAYIIMEYLDGITLKNYVENNGPMDTSTFFRRLIPVLTSLEKIHKQGMIHRDISPDNLMLMNDGFLKLFDFGAAREYSDATQPNFSVIIKPCFAPEEQYRSKGVQGPWTDVYSICATIYFSITGVVPDDSLQRAFSDELKKPSELGVRISPKIEATLLKGMSVRSADRFDSVMPLVYAFEEADIKPTRKEKKPKRKKTSGIFSIFHTLSTQGAPVSTDYHPTSSSQSDKTEIILNTEYDPSVEQEHNPANNAVKKRLKSDLSNQDLSSHSEKNNADTNEQTESLSVKSDRTEKKEQVSQINAPVLKKENSGISANPSEGNINANNIAEKSAAIGKTNAQNTVGVVCQKCKAVLPDFAKFCGVCGEPYLPIKKPTNAVSVSHPKVNISQNIPQPQSKKIATSTTIICPKCKSVLPKNAKFCGKCGLSLSNGTAGANSQ